MGADFSRVGLRLEAVAVAAYRFHEGRIVAGGVNLVTQTLDVGVHRLGLGEVLPAPGVAKQILAGDHLAGVLHERGQKLELAGRQVDLAVVAGGSVGVLIQRDARSGDGIARAGELDRKSVV